MVPCKNRHEYTCYQCCHVWQRCGAMFNLDNKSDLSVSCPLCSSSHTVITRCIGKTTCNNTGIYIKEKPNVFVSDR